MSREIRKLYVGIRGGGPYTDVIDIDTHEVIRTIRMHRGVQNIYVTDDERWAVASLAPGPDNPEWQMLASWVRGELTGSTCPG
jgi:hypothetical protein